MENSIILRRKFKVYDDKNIENDMIKNEDYKLHKKYLDSNVVRRDIKIIRSNDNREIEENVDSDLKYRVKLKSELKRKQF